MDRLLIIDGSNLLFQMFFGMPARIVNSKGKAIQGTLGFVGAMLKIIRMTKPTHVIVVFDGEHENARADLNEDYKANRPDYSQVEDEDNPFSQLGDIYSALDFMRVKYAETTDCETDDVVAAYALSCGGYTEVVISSFDSDFFQLITENIRVLRYRGDSTVVCDTEFVIDKFGVQPSAYADFKSLVGDAADNIRGADKVGAKTAAALINRYGCLENVLCRAETIEKPSIRDSVIRNCERLKVNYRLIKLTDGATLPFDISKLAWQDSGMKTNDILIGIGLR
ncbi:MAG: 5'-3' exonuclease H3TH domain-containing protein [Eubacteriales bacterium]|nr:5'-3' exonuclease H3TH domain-containing protein [Eubacteriales bacterium]MDD3882362.1 5'-3' exonuclease H3TH domain-containing protein [Eubacteriales bacterium]MDD4512417.1 5'-3' exonuclease H3TH domain-containing protein [Eubacteriales bacterium]